MSAEKCFNIGVAMVAFDVAVENENLIWSFFVADFSIEIYESVEINFMWNSLELSLPRQPKM